MRVFRYIYLLSFLFNFLSATVILKAPSSFVEDEAVIFTFIAVGDGVRFPNIDEIDGYKVQLIASSSSVVNLKSNIIEKKSKTYQLFAKKDITIPSYVFQIDGREYKSKSQNIVMEKIKKTKSKYADFTIQTDKKEVYVGEEFRLKLIFKYAKDLNVDALGLADIKFEDFWYKPLKSNNKRYELNNFIYQELEFLMFAQKEGRLTIRPLRVDMQVLDERTAFSFLTNEAKIYKIYSNNLNIKAKKLPNDLTLIGDFNIKATVDKTQINQGESLSLKVEVDGYGNIDDLDDFKLTIANATIYENKANIRSILKDGKSYGNYSKVFSVIPNESLTIPSFKIEYFDLEKKEKISKKTEDFKIEVKKQVLQKRELVKPEIEKKKIIKKVVVTKSSLKEKIIYFVCGFIMCLLIIGLYVYVIKLKNKKTIDEIPLVKRVKKANSKDELIKILVPYLRKDSGLDLKIFQLEKVQNDDEFKDIKKEILKVVKREDKDASSSIIFN